MRRAFAALGHDVWSCDLLPAEDGSNRHIVGDVRDLLSDGWDLLAVMHPPCTRLCNSGVRWLHERDLWADLDEACALFTACWQAPIERVCVENPIMHSHARQRLPADLAKPQIVQPWWFGEPYFKATGLYLRGLPQLVETDRLTPPKRALEPDRHKDWSAVHRAPPGPDRWRFRSRTFDGVARAMAAQFAGPCHV